MSQMDISDILGAVASNGPALTTYQRKMNAILTHFAQRGIPLSVAADAKHMNRSVRTLKKRARELGLVFPDYTPQAMRPAKGS